MRRGVSWTRSPFVSVGDTVKKGQVLGIVEAMKLMNEIESEYGRRGESHSMWKMSRWWNMVSPCFSSDRRRRKWQYCESKKS